MELRYLRYFIAVAEELNFSHASERLRVDQSALSRRIQDLEYELQVPLFTRTQHGVTLTLAGAVFLEEAKHIMADTELAIQTARRAARGEVGRLAIGYIGALSDRLIPRALRKYRERFPNVSGSLQHMRPAGQIAALLGRKIDLGFVGQPNPEYEVQLVFEVFRRDPMEVVLAQGHPLLGRKQIRMRDLAGERFILGSRAGSPFHYDWLLRLCHEAGFNPNVVQEVEYGQTAVELVAAGFGVALFPATMQARTQDDVVFRALKGVPPYQHSVAWRRGETSPLVESFVSLLREELGLKPPVEPAKPNSDKTAK